MDENIKKLSLKRWFFASANEPLKETRIIKCEQMHLKKVIFVNNWLPVWVLTKRNIVVTNSSNN